MDEKHVGTELKAALTDLRQLATQLAGASREWWGNRRQEMNQYNRNNDQQRSRRGERETSRGYGEGYGTAGVQGRDWENQDSHAGRDQDDARWGRGHESDEDVRSQYDVSGRDYGGYSQRHGGRERSGSSEYASGAREYGRAFEDSGSGQRRQSYARGDYADQGGDYSQGYGRERDPGRVYGPEDFSQRYQQGNVFADEGYGEGGGYAGERSSGGGSWRERAGSRDYYGGSGRGNQQFTRGSGQRGFGDEYGYGGQGRGDQGRSASGGNAYGYGGGGSSSAGRGGSGQYGYGGGYGSYGQSSGYGAGGSGGYSQSDYGQPDYGQSRSSGARPGIGGEQAQSGRYAEGQSHRGRGPRGYSRSDERITEDLNERFTDDHQLDASEIQVSVSGGVATLSGTVEQRWLKHRAEDIAESCSGVKDVRNDIRVVSSSSRASESSAASSGSFGGNTPAGSDNEASRTRGASSASATSKSGTGAGSGSSATTGAPGSGGTPGSTH